MSDSLPLWDRCLNDLRYQLKENEFTMWLRPLSAKVVGDKLELLAPNQYFVSHVKENHFDAIEQLAKQHSNGEISQVIIQVESSVQPSYQESSSAEMRGGVSQSKASTTQLTTAHNTANDVSTLGSDKSLSYINPYFTFETFVSGKSNMLAYKACQELGKKQSQNRHNPLFLYGASGLGKTHLMHSVAHKYLKIGKTFYYFSSEKFINQLVYALRNQKIEQFKRKIKRVSFY